MLDRHRKCRCSSEFERRDYLVARLKTIPDLNEYLPPRAMAKLDITQTRLRAIREAVGCLLVLILVILKWLSIPSHLPITLPLARLAFGVKPSRCNAPAAPGRCTWQSGGRSCSERRRDHERRPESPGSDNLPSPAPPSPLSPSNNIAPFHQPHFYPLPLRCERSFFLTTSFNTHYLSLPVPFPLLCIHPQGPTAHRLPSPSRIMVDKLSPCQT